MTLLNFPSSIIPKDCLVEKGGDLSLGDIRRYWEKTYLGDNESREKKRQVTSDLHTTQLRVKRTDSSIHE